MNVRIFSSSIISGFEFALLTAPRSLQATAMGMIAAVDGPIDILFLVFFLDGFELSVAQTPEVYAIGMALVFISMILIIVLERRFDLGLRRI